jgi:hypothetical protein
MAIACAKYFDSVMVGTLRHTDQPQVNVSLSVAGKRPVRSGWAWNKNADSGHHADGLSDSRPLGRPELDNVKKPTRSAEKRKVVVRS